MICNLCPRQCGALRDETHGEGFCGMPSVPVLARAALHRWEEPPVSGKNGSGAVFFSGCPLGCVFCQNDQISRQGFGQPVTEARLGEIFRELVAQGAHNINLVSPTHCAHVLRRVLASEKPPVPVVWNTGGYERVETLRGLEGLVDVYLPDLKYLDSRVAARYSSASDYPEVAKAAILEMYRQTGPVVLEDGLIKRGGHHPASGAARSAGRGQGGDGLGGGDLSSRRGAVLPDEPVCPLRQGGGLPGNRPPPSAGRGPEGQGVHGRPGAGGVHPGGQRRQRGVYSQL